MVVWEGAGGGKAQPAATACGSDGVELQDVRSSSLTSRSTTVDWRPDTWLSRAVTRSRVAFELAWFWGSTVFGGSVRCVVGTVAITAKADSGLGASERMFLASATDTTGEAPGKGVKSVGRVQVADIVVSAVLAASAPGA